MAERVLLLVYKVNPRLVRKQLPPDDDITRRNLLYRQLFTEFDKIDSQVLSTYKFLTVFFKLFFFILKRKRELLDEKRNEMATSMYEPQLLSMSGNGDTLKKRYKVENSVSFSHSRVSLTLNFVRIIYLNLIFSDLIIRTINEEPKNGRSRKSHPI